MTFTRRSVVVGAASAAGCRLASPPRLEEDKAMMTIRPSAARGGANHGWLDTKHTFSFASYFDERHMGFRSLRVINEDKVSPGAGFGTHPHRDMEIISYVLAGGLEHKDSMGTGSVIRPGDVQRMSAGTGVFHSEFNASKTEPVHFLQIWLIPDAQGVTPSYEQRRFEDAERRGALRLVASPTGAEGSVSLHTDAKLYAALLGTGEKASLTLAPERHAWVHVARGAVEVNGKTLGAGDGAALSNEREVRLAGVDAAEVLVFDLA